MYRAPDGQTIQAGHENTGRAPCEAGVIADCPVDALICCSLIPLRVGLHITLSFDTLHLKNGVRVALVDYVRLSSTGRAAA